MSTIIDTPATADIAADDTFDAPEHSGAAPGIPPAPDPGQHDPEPFPEPADDAASEDVRIVPVPNGAETDEADPAAGAPEPSEVRRPVPDSSRPSLVFVDPATVTVETNVRKTPRVGREFVASVKRHGVLVAMRGYVGADGKPVIRDGLRRILAAQKAGVTEAPAIIYPNRDALLSTEDAERERIIEQISTNSNREALTDAEEADAIQQLALSGLEPTVIAKELAVKRARVNAALTVAGNDTARRVVERRQITLDQAAVIAEFSDDPQAVKMLTGVATDSPHGFAHEAQRIRDRKARARAEQEFVDDLTARGIPLVDAPDEHDKRSKDAYLADLQDEDGKPLDPADWEGKPGHAVALRTRWGTWRPAHVITDWRSHGLRLTTRGGAVTGKLTEQEKQARREVVTNNKEWDSAETVRREWITGLLSRRGLPKDADQFTAHMATARAAAFAKSLESGLAATLLGIQPNPGALATYLAANPAKARQVTFALAVAAGELSLDRWSWRRHDRRDREFLNWLTAWGYTTSRVEDIIAKPVQSSPAEDADAPEPGTQESDVPEPDTQEEAPAPDPGIDADTGDDLADDSEDEEVVNDATESEDENAENAAAAGEDADDDDEPDAWYDAEQDDDLA